MRLRNHLLFTIFSALLFSCAPPPVPEIKVQELRIVEAEQRSIIVNGSGEIKVAPDFAEVVFGIYTSNKDVNIAKEENNDIARNVLKVLREHHIEEDDIKIDYLSIFSESPESSSEIYRFGARNGIKVTVHDLLKLELIITEVLKVGGNRLLGVYFRVSELEKYRAEARELAVQSAKEKAQNMASELGQEIDAPLLVEEFVPYPETNSSYASFSLSLNDYSSLNFEQINIAAFGQITIRANVRIKFSLK